MVAILVSASVAGGKIYAGQAPETLALPIAVVEHQGEIPEWRSGGDYIETTTLVVHCFAKTLAAMDVVQLAVKAALDWCDQDGNFSVDDAQAVEVRRMRYQSTVVDTRAPDAEIVFDGQVTYQIKIQRTDTHA